MKIVLYFSPDSNCSLRVKWALDYKGLEYEEVDITKIDDAGRFYQLSPYGYVPVVTIDGEVISESMAIVELIDEMGKENTLFPGDRINRAKVREICEFINSTIHPAQNSSILNYLLPELIGKDKSELRAQWIRQNLDKLSPRLWKSSSYAAGHEFSLADIFLYEICKKVNSLGYELDEKFSTYIRFINESGYRNASWMVET